MTETGLSQAEIHHTHRDVTGGWLRPSVFGAMDGLVSNSALIAGLAGGAASHATIVLAGLAGLAAGAFSMAAGEYTSVASQSELALAEIALERDELKHRPEAEEAELAALYASRGIEESLAREVARQLSRDPEQALIVHTREELGIAADSLPSPLLAAGWSFCAFAVGAFLPLLPYLAGARSFAPALVVTAVALFLAGALVSRVTARSWWYTGLRQLFLGGVAGAVTYAIGAAVGHSLN